MTTTVLLCALSLSVGFLAGIALDDALDLYRASRKERPMPRIHLPGGRAVLGALLTVAVVLQLGVGVLIIFERAARQDYADCTTNWQQQFAAAYETRIEVNNAANGALEQVVRAVGAQDPDRFEKAVDEYLRLRDTQIREAKRNPYPPLPDELCGEKP